MPNNCQVYPEDTAANLPPKSSLSTGSLTGSLWSISSKAGSKALSAIDYIGLKLADAFGITSSRYEEYLWEAERMKKKASSHIQLGVCYKWSHCLI